MEINITRLFNGAAPMDYSASVAEIGRDAGPSTWRAACDDAENWNPLDTSEKREAFRVFIRSAGAWSDDEIAGYSDQYLNALCVQWVSGDMREVPGITMGPGMSDAEWEDYQKLSESGTVCGRFFKADDGAIYWDMQ